MEQTSFNLDLPQNQILPQLAKHMAVKNWYTNINGHDIFVVVEDWHKSEIQLLEGIEKSSDALDFEEKLNSSENTGIYLSSLKDIPFELLKRILLRTRTSKSIFIGSN